MHRTNALAHAFGYPNDPTDSLPPRQRKRCPLPFQAQRARPPDRREGFNHKLIAYYDNPCEELVQQSGYGSDAPAAKLTVRFAHPYSPWEHGAREHQPADPPTTQRPPDRLGHRPNLAAIAEELEQLPPRLPPKSTPTTPFEQLLVASTT